MSWTMPAAQYLRMSTEHQRYSIENQSAAIKSFAERNNYFIVHTYCDAGKSGLTIKRRDGLASLLNDVVRGDATYKAILVYDVSRWGRFQDNDEAAHYEFICKSAGIPIVYCFETFTNDCTLVNMIAKSLKRSMAGEYSRELSVRVLDTQRRMCARGFKPGGQAGFGLRRFLVSEDPNRRRILEQYQYKGIHSDHIILVPGPQHEVAAVRRIYREFLENRTPLVDIADMLNRDHVNRASGKEWRPESVREVLRNPKYKGACVYGRTTARLGTRQKRLPKSLWQIHPRAYLPVISSSDFDSAQRIFANRANNKSNDMLIEEIRNLLKRTGRLCRREIEAAGIASLDTLDRRLGGLKRIYEQLEYDTGIRFKPIDSRGRSLSVRQQLLEEIVARFPMDVEITPKHGTLRSNLLVKKAIEVGVSVITPKRAKNGHLSWLLSTTRLDVPKLVLAVLLGETTDVMQFILLPKPMKRHTALGASSPHETVGIKLQSLASFVPACLQEAHRLT